jgi:raffinose/stachyose/melibiose transport system substrate-binding protein
MKKLSGIMLCMVMMVLASGLVFAGGRSQGGGSQGSGATAQKKLVLYTEYTDATLDGLKDKAREFSNANPGVTIEIMSSASQDFDTFFKTAVAGDEKIDIVEVNVQFYRDYVTRGFLQPIEPYVDFTKAPLVDMAWTQEKYFSRKDKRYGVPTVLSSSAFYYNPAIFRQYNIDIPKTWDDIFAMKDKLAAGGISPMVYAGAEPWWNPMHFNIIFYQMTKNQGLEINDRFMAGDFSPEVIKPYVDTLQFFADLDAKGILIPGTQGMDTPSAVTVFSSGKAAMYYSGTWFEQSLASIAPNFQYRIFPVPVLDTSLKSQAAGSINALFGIYSKAEYPDIAGKFIEFWAGTKAQQEIRDAGQSIDLPVTVGVKSDPNNPVKVTFDEIVPSTTIWLDAIWEPEIITDFQQGCQAAILKQKTPTQIMDEIVAHYKQLREQKKTFF